MTYVPANISRFSGFAELYDDARPTPPPAVCDLLCATIGVKRPKLVVDIGAGTGLSTLLWATRADAAVGVEPSDDMRQVAERRATGIGNVSFRAGFSAATGLPDQCADIVTASQALHWMPPDETFAEVARILRPGGVFAAYDCDWPVSLNWRAEQAYIAAWDRAAPLERANNTAEGVQRWGKEGHLERMRASGRFRYVREATLHHTEKGDAERLVRTLLSQGGVAGLLKAGLSEEEVGIAQFRAELAQIMGDAVVPWFWSYRVRLGVV